MNKEIKVDYCIVGGGIAGIIVASKLAETGKSIVILDQGPRYSEEDRANILRQAQENLDDRADYNDHVDSEVLTPFSFAKSNGNVVEWAKYCRLFGIGGTALHFGALMMRPRVEDFSVKTRYGYGRDWPISYSELEPWLLKAEYEIGVSGNNDNPYASPRSGPFPMPAHPFSYFEKEFFGPGLKKLGIVGHSTPRGVNSIVYKGRSACQACRVCRFCPTGARYSPDRVHVPFLDKQPNISILENISVRKLETDVNGEKIIAAHAIRFKEKTPLIVLAKQFILAMGGLETPRMLMLSSDNSHHQNGLGNMGGQLGRGFSDHPIPYITYEMEQPAGSRLGFGTMITDHFRASINRSEHPSFVLFTAAMDRYPVGNHALNWASDSTVLNLKTLRERLPQMVTLNAFTELEGKGRLELDHHKLDAFGSPVAKVTMTMTDWDRRGFKRVDDLTDQLAEVMGVKNISKNTSPEEGLGLHPAGTTAMAKNPDEGVCDKNLQVYGLENLYIVSSSVFPHMASNPPTLTIVALALRVAEYLEGKSKL